MSSNGYGEDTEYGTASSDDLSDMNSIFPIEGRQGRRPIVWLPAIAMPHVDPDSAAIAGIAGIAIAVAAAAVAGRLLVQAGMQASRQLPVLAVLGVGLVLGAIVAAIALRHGYVRALAIGVLLTASACLGEFLVFVIPPALVAVSLIGVALSARNRREGE